MRVKDNVKKDNEQNMLDKISKDNPFKVPDGYFENLSERIEARIDNAVLQPVGREVRKNVFAEVLWPRLRPVLYVAAVVAFMYGVTFLATRPAVNAASSFDDIVGEYVGTPEYEEEVKTFYLDDMDVYDVYEFLTMNY